LVAESFLNHIPNGHTIVVDHIDENPLNNNINNIRLITHRENVSRGMKNRSSKYVGAYWYKSKKRWRSTIYIDGKNIHLGTFKNDVEAHEAYKKALIDYERN